MALKAKNIIVLSKGCPMKAEQIFRSSQYFENPFATLNSTQRYLKKLTEKNILNRKYIESDIPGNPEYEYFPHIKAKNQFPEELEGIRTDSLIFQGNTEPRKHNLWISEFVSYFFKHAGEAKERVNIISLHRFFKSQTEYGLLKTDQAIFAVLDGVPVMLPIEIQRSENLSKFEQKIPKYRDFFRNRFHSHPVIRSIQKQIQAPLQGGQVLVITTDGRNTKPSLISCARRHDIKKMMWFAEMKDIEEQNQFLSPVWTIPMNRKKNRDKNHISLLG